MRVSSLLLFSRAVLAQAASLPATKAGVNGVPTNAKVHAIEVSRPVPVIQSWYCWYQTGLERSGGKKKAWVRLSVFPCSREAPRVPGIVGETGIGGARQRSSRRPIKGELGRWRGVGKGAGSVIHCRCVLGKGTLPMGPSHGNRLTPGVGNLVTDAR